MSQCRCYESTSVATSYDEEVHESAKAWRDEATEVFNEPFDGPDWRAERLNAARELHDATVAEIRARQRIDRGMKTRNTDDNINQGDDQ